MRRIARRLLMLAAAMSLIVFAAVCTLWARGYWSPVRVAGFPVSDPRPGVRAAVHVWVSRGQATVVWSEYLARYGNARPRPEGETFDTLVGIRGPGLLGRMRFSSGGYIMTRTQTQTWLWTSPMWAIAGATALLPAAWAVIVLARRRAARLRSANCQCVACGYDLRATRDRCPECGCVPAVELQPAA